MLIWDLVAGKLLQTLQVQHCHLTSFEFCPVEFVLAGVTSGKAVKLWDLESFDLLGTTPAETSAIRCMCFAPKVKRLVSATESTLRMWEWDPLRPRAAVEVGWDRVADMRFVTDDRVQAGSFISNFVSIWSVDTSQKSAALQSPQPERAKSGINQANTPKVNNLEAMQPAPRNPATLDPSRHRTKQEEIVKVRAEVSSKVRGESKEEPPPVAVNWESGMSARDLSASMGESFLRRLREQKEIDAKAALEDERLSMEALQELLPSPSKNKPVSRVYDEEDEPVRKQQVELASPRAERRPRSVADTRPAVQSPAGAAINVVGSRVASYSGEEAKSRDSAPTPADIISSSSRVLSQLSARLGLLRVLRKYWEKGEVADAVVQIQSMHEGSRHDSNQIFPVADFFTSADLGACSLNLDICVALLPVLEAMTNVPTEYIVQAALKGITVLQEAFGDLIRQTRATMSIGGVDLSREERLNKCNACHSIFVRVKGQLIHIKNKFRYVKTIISYVDALKVALSDY